MKKIASTFLLFSFAWTLQATEPVLYIYGDVADNGTIPSGDKDPFHQMRLHDEGPRGMSDFTAAIEEVGFAITEKYDAAIELTADFLKDYRVIILGSNQRVFSLAEAQAVKQWVEQGGGLMAWSDSAFGGHYRKAGIANPAGRNSNNSLTEQFGMYFLTDNGGGNYLISQFTEDHYLNNFQREGGLRYRGEGVSCVRVASPARMLAPLQDGGLGGRLAVNKVDGTYQPIADAALAVAEIGKGRVIGNFDRNCFWNAGEGTRLSHVDNREFTQRLVVWAAGQEDAVKVTRKALPASGKLNQPPVVSAGGDQTVDTLQADLSGTISDDGQPNRFPNVRWKKRKGPGNVKFENNNANTPAVRVFFNKPGVYIMQLIVNDGEFSVKDDVVVTVTGGKK